MFPVVKTIENSGITHYVYSYSSVLEVRGGDHSDKMVVAGDLDASALKLFWLYLVPYKVCRVKEGLNLKDACNAVKDAYSRGKLDASYKRTEGEWQAQLDDFVNAVEKHFDFDFTESPFFVFLGDDKVDRGNHEGMIDYLFRRMHAAQIAAGNMLKYIVLLSNHGGDAFHFQAEGYSILQKSGCGGSVVGTTQAQMTTFLSSPHYLDHFRAVYYFMLDGEVYYFTHASVSLDVFKNVCRDLEMQNPPRIDPDDIYSVGPVFDAINKKLLSDLKAYFDTGKKTPALYRIILACDTVRDDSGIEALMWSREFKESKKYPELNVKNIHGHNFCSGSLGVWRSAGNTYYFNMDNSFDKGVMLDAYVPYFMFGGVSPTPYQTVNDLVSGREALIEKVLPSLKLNDRNTDFCLRERYKFLDKEYEQAQEDFLQWFECIASVIARIGVGWRLDFNMIKDRFCKGNEGKFFIQCMNRLLMHKGHDPLDEEGIKAVCCLLMNDTINFNDLVESSRPGEGDDNGRLFEITSRDSTLAIITYFKAVFECKESYFYKKQLELQKEIPDLNTFEHQQLIDHYANYIAAMSKRKDRLYKTLATEYNFCESQTEAFFGEMLLNCETILDNVCDDFVLNKLPLLTISEAHSIIFMLLEKAPEASIRTFCDNNSLTFKADYFTLGLEAAEVFTSVTPGGKAEADAYKDRVRAMTLKSASDAGAGAGAGSEAGTAAHVLHGPSGKCAKQHDAALDCGAR